MATTTDIKNGICIELNGNLFYVVEFQHVKPGKGPAFVRTKLKNVKTGKVIDNTFPCLLYTSPSPRDRQKSRMPSSA